MPERPEFVSEPVNNPGYLDKHGRLMFEEGQSFSGFERDKVWLNQDGRFLDVSAVSGADDAGDGRALLVADFDDDGDEDLFVHDTQRDRHHLYRNDVGDGDGAASIKVRLLATAGHSSAAGAVVHVKSGGRDRAKVLAYGSGFLSQNPAELVFGVGDAASAEVRVAWPGRAEESFGAVERGATCLLVEGAGTPQIVERKPFRFLDPNTPGLRVRKGERLTTLPLINHLEAPLTVDVAGRERPLIINFWALWCQACMGELEALAALAAKGEYDVLLIGVDKPEERGRADSVLDRLGIDLQRSYLTEAAAATLLDPTRLPLPTSLIVSPGGVVKEIHQGGIQSWSGYQP